MKVRLVNSKLSFADDGRKTITLFDACIKLKASNYNNYGTFTKLIPGKKYTFSFKSTDSFTLYLRDKDNNNVNFKVNGGTETILLNVSSGDNSYDIEVLSDTYFVRVTDNTATDVYVTVTTRAMSFTRTLIEEINAPAMSSGYVDYALTNTLPGSNHFVIEISSEQPDFKLTIKNSNKDLVSYIELSSPYFSYGCVYTQDVKYIRVTDNADYPVNIKLYRTEIVY